MSDEITWAKYRINELEALIAKPRTRKTTNAERRKEIESIEDHVLRCGNLLDSILKQSA